MPVTFYLIYTKFPWIHNVRGNTLEVVGYHRQSIKKSCTFLHILFYIFNFGHCKVQKPTGSVVEWVECSLIIGTGNWVQVFLAWSSIAHSVCQQRARSLLEIQFQRLWFESCIQRRKATCPLLIRKSFAVRELRNWQQTCMYVCMYACPSDEYCDFSWTFDH